MGCAGSKPADDPPAVLLCRRRCEHLQKAIDYRYDFANSHAAYLHSLRAVGQALSDFFLSEPAPSATPVLTLPGHYKTKGMAPPPGMMNHIPPLSPPAKPQNVPNIAAGAPNHHHSRSNSGSHLHFVPTDSESDSDDGPLHSDHGTPYYPHVPPKSGGGNDPYDYPFPPMNTTTTTTYYNFAQKSGPASVTYEQRPYNLGSVQVGAFDSSSSGGGGLPTAYPYFGNGDSYSNTNQSNNSNNYGAAASSSAGSFPFAYPSYQYPDPYSSSGGTGAGGFFGGGPSLSQPPQVGGPGASSSNAGPRAPPPPPSPPKASPWDFINVFDSYESYLPTNFTPSRSSRDLREEEGIPELEEDDQEVTKETYAKTNRSAGDAPPRPSPQMDEGPRRSGVGEEMHYKMRTVPENDVAHAEDRGGPASGNVQKQEDGFKRNIVPGSRSLPDTIKLVKDMFEKSSTAAEEFRDVLEVGKIQYHERKYQVVPSKLIRPITSPVSVLSSSLSSTVLSSSEASDTASSLRSEIEDLESKSLSCILHKLLIWETKLLDEVRAEEDMQLLLEKKRRKLKRLDDKGAEDIKIDSTRRSVKRLSTRIKVAIQVVETIAVKISTLRDAELWRELQVLIQGLVKIWKAMTECHKIQCQAIIESRSLDVVSDSIRLSDAQSEAIEQLVIALHRWSSVFSDWVSAQKHFVNSLNDWLRDCIRDEPEETVDGPLPFSPGRLGAPSVFVICNSWAQALKLVSESEVLDAMKSLNATTRHIWDRHCTQIAFGSAPKGLKELEAKKQRVLRELGESRTKKQRRGELSDGVYEGEVVADVGGGGADNLWVNLRNVFEAMERFTDSSTRAYEGLWARCVEENRPRTNAGTS